MAALDPKAGDSASGGAPGGDARGLPRRRAAAELAAALLAIALRPRRSTGAQAALVTKIGRFRYGDDLIDVRFQVHAADMADDGATIEPAVTRTLKGSVTRVQGRLERKSIGDAFRVLRVQEPDGSWHDVDIWVPVRLESP